MDEHALIQASAGEFDPPHLALAVTTTAHRFAACFGVPVGGTCQWVVHVDGHEYYWSRETNRFDGWGRRL